MSPMYHSAIPPNKLRLLHRYVTYVPLCNSSKQAQAVTQICHLCTTLQFLQTGLGCYTDMSPMYHSAIPPNRLRLLHRYVTYVPLCNSSKQTQAVPQLCHLCTTLQFLQTDSGCSTDMSPMYHSAIPPNRLRMFHRYVTYVPLRNSSKQTQAVPQICHLCTTLQFLQTDSGCSTVMSPMYHSAISPNRLRLFHRYVTYVPLCNSSKQTQAVTQICHLCTTLQFLQTDSGCSTSMSPMYHSPIPPNRLRLLHRYVTYVPLCNSSKQTQAVPHLCHLCTTLQF